MLTGLVLKSYAVDLALCLLSFTVVTAVIFFEPALTFLESQYKSFSVFTLK